LRSLGFIGTRIPAVTGLHDVEQNLRLLSALNIDPGVPQSPCFQLREADHQRAAELLAAIGIDDEPFIAIHSGSAKTVLARAKRWPAQKYASLIQMLASDYRTVWIEGPDEAGVAGEILHHSQR